MILAFAWPAAAAQRNQSSPLPKWAPQYPPDIGQATPAERAVAMATMQEIERILAQVPELAQPRGFEVGKQIYGGTLPLGERGVLSYTFFLWFYVPSKAATYGEGSRCIGVTVNGVGMGEVIEDEAGRVLIVEKDVGESRPGVTIVYEGLRWDTPNADRRNGYMTISTGGKSPWIPVTREQYLRARIFGAEGKNGEKETEFKKSLEKTSYERWIEEAPARKKNRDDAVAAMARAQGRAAAEDFRKSQEEIERQTGEQLRAEEAEERKQYKEALSNRYGDMLRAQIAAMTPAERASPATAELSGRLVARDDPVAHRVLTPDPEFWRVRRSRAEAHTIVLGFRPTQFCENPAVQAALSKAYQTFDVAAFRRIVDRP